MYNNVTNYDFVRYCLSSNHFISCFVKVNSRLGFFYVCAIRRSLFANKLLLLLLLLFVIIR